MAKINRHGQAEIIGETEYLKIRKTLKGWHQIFWDIAYYTGERWGAIAALRVEDVFIGPGKPREHITFRARTRKADPQGRRHTRQVPIHPTLAERLKAYDAMPMGWMFPSDRRVGEHICFDTADAFLRTALEKCGYEYRGISTHSTRRSLITRLDEKGVALKVIQKITGHSDLKTLGRYIEVSPERVKQAMSII